jgi:hypothetical protein
VARLVRWNILFKNQISSCLQVFFYTANRVFSSNMYFKPSLIFAGKAAQAAKVLLTTNTLAYFARACTKNVIEHLFEFLYL